MKSLYLVRHAQAALRKADLPDFERTLVKAGEKTSVNMAKKFKKQGLSPDLLISSTASRALETAHIFAKVLGYPIEKIMVKEELYHEMDPESLLAIIRKVDSKYESLMLFGHNPAFTELAGYLISDFQENMPKTAIVGMKFLRRNWKYLSQGDGKLTLFDYPKRMAKTTKVMQLDLEANLTEKIQSVLSGIDPKTAAKESKIIRRSARRITESFMQTLKTNKGKQAIQEYVTKSQTTKKT